MRVERQILFSKKKKKKKRKKEKCFKMSSADFFYPAYKVLIIRLLVGRQYISPILFTKTRPNTKDELHRLHDP